MATTIHTILEEFRQAATSNPDLGGKFERLIANYLVTDPLYKDKYSNVWLWMEWPGRANQPDTGIDLVAEERCTGELCGIQCKFFDPAHWLQKSDIDSFFTASGKFPFTSRMIVSTTDNWSHHAEEALSDQQIPVVRLRVQDLADSPIDWGQFSLNRPQDIKLKEKKTLKGHQTEALDNTTEGFKLSDRGKLIMACGTGKTFASLKIAEAMVPTNGLVLFLAPSISLISQTLREWTAEAAEPIHAFAVCSDTKVGKENEDIRTHDLAIPATTDARKLAEAIKAVSPDRRTVIFSTYQSIDVSIRAQSLGLGEFDLIVCDEAHRTTGITLDNEDASDFVKVHNQTAIRAKKRLYMTATPRIYADASKGKADERDAVMYSMDDEDTFGPEFYRLGFGKAVDLKELAEYKVLIVAVDELLMACLANDYNAFKLDKKRAIDTRFATKVIGSWKGLSKQGLVLVDEDGEQVNATEDMAPMRRAVAFSRSIAASKETKEVFAELAGMYAKSHLDDEGVFMIRCDLDHVDGTMNALKRQNALEWLRQDTEEGQCRILSNARCLSEGIDVPALDAVIFFDTRESVVDIVQSVGRVMRKAEGKKYGYIILPVCIPSGKVKDYNNYIDGDPQFKGIWKVLKALRAHDESLVDEAEFRRKIKVVGRGGKGGDGKGTGGGENLPIDFPDLSIDDISDAVYAAIPKKLGDREYWSEWAKSVAQIAESLIARIRALLTRPEARQAFDAFLKGLQDNLNPAVGEGEAIEMLAQHVITRPVFEALFEGYSFTQNNPVSKAMQAVIEIMDDHVVSKETESLEKFYGNIRERVGFAKSDKSRQEIVKNLYDTFFNNAFPRMAERLGIVYTPVEVVDFIIKSAEAALRKHFNSGLSDEGVQILDPFTGTGTFIVRLLQSGLIKPEDLQHKYHKELHANEIVLLAYYIAAINIESSYHALTGKYSPFDGIVLTDTFQMAEIRDLVDSVVLPENSERVNIQKQQVIRVIIGNPPYSAGQGSANDNNQNLSYPALDARIRETYAAKSSATNKNSLYDSYIRAIRWASDRIKDKGIVAFVTNGSFIDGNAADGLRKCLAGDFSHLYVFNVRGNQRTAGELSRQEGGKIFGSGSRAPVAITIMVKDPDHKGPCELRYHDIGDYINREEKLAIVEGFGNIDAVPWQRVEPNSEGDWINHRDPVFDWFMPMGDKEDVSENTLFSIYSLGLKSNRDAWVYNFSKGHTVSNMERMISFYNEQVQAYKKSCEGKDKARYPAVDGVVDSNPAKISWSGNLKSGVERLKQYHLEESACVPSMYRPFSKQWLYFSRYFNERVYQMPRLFPTPEHRNIVISATGIGATKAFSALATKTLPDLEMISKGQCFPLYWYEKAEESKADAHPDMHGHGEPSIEPDEQGYIRHEAITDWALSAFRDQYQDQTITKEDIFYYVYGILHSPEYKQRFGSDLKKMLPRIPYAGDFWAFSNAGHALGKWHLDYETVEPYPLGELFSQLALDPKEHYRVKKMNFARKGKEIDKTAIAYNSHLTLTGIPLEAYGYIVNGKPALDWIMERYAVTKDKDSGIANDPNDWSEDPRYIVDLVKRIVRVSLETVRIVEGLPALNESNIDVIVQALKK